MMRNLHNFEPAAPAPAAPASPAPAPNIFGGSRYGDEGPASSGQWRGRGIGRTGDPARRLGTFTDPASVPPLGVPNGEGQSIDKSLTVSPNVSINVQGVNDPGEAARMIGAHQDRVTSDLVRTGLGAMA